MCYVHAVEYCSTIKRNDVLIHATACLGHENIVNIFNVTKVCT